MRNSDAYPKTAEEYKYLFDRLPDDVAISLATRPFNMLSPTYCVCGWILRETSARAEGVDAAQIDLHFIALRNPAYNVSLDFHGWMMGTLIEHYGGTREEWDDIYGGVCYPESRLAIEAALTNRVEKAKAKPSGYSEPAFEDGHAEVLHVF